ncbi:MAG: cryptochrome/photolyase family protein, partial [Candidatus Omnitrophica bacterium]|nr:cryptochrome/photolyase family protein [Candidatus Omnitrophota bacterium]
EMVEARFPDHPGTLDHFNLPVSRQQALYLLRHFAENCLESFGPYQDAMWTDEPFLHHSRLSAPLNLKLLNPREVLDTVIDRAHETGFPLNSLEGFVRQILGWREYIRGIYWLEMPKYLDLNVLDTHEEMPSFYWDGETEMECLRQSMKQVLDHGYAHHIQRLMVLGLFSMLYGVDPKKFHKWHMAMYVDAIDWVSLPNALGMSQYGDGGIVGSKPYCASANYINKMSNYCKHCPYDPKKIVGDKACPFNALYWSFLDRHANRFVNNSRMKFQIKNLEKKKPKEREEIREEARKIRKRIRGERSRLRPPRTEVQG